MEQCAAQDSFPTPQQQRSPDRRRIKRAPVPILRTKTRRFLRVQPDAQSRGRAERRQRWKTHKYSDSFVHHGGSDRYKPDALQCGGGIWLYESWCAFIIKRLIKTNHTSGNQRVISPHNKHMSTSEGAVLKNIYKSDNLPTPYFSWSVGIHMFTIGAFTVLSQECE